MTLSPGGRFGKYQVLESLGSGGMGEVFRARDSRLGRDVALKVLPASAKADRVRLARFEHEARVLASLNHPNIGTLHEIEEQDGVQALVLELVEGETLAERLRVGPLPIAQALDAAQQIAAALEAAHESGIVHLDVKPGNVKLRADGRVKLLDFGVAQVLDAPAAGPSPEPDALLATHDAAASGTPPYMSPEQVRGRAVDRRSDVWAFGCVLYEMLAGRRAFAGATAADTVVAILEREPDWSLLPPATPLIVRRLLRRCLAKDRNDRLRHVGDAAIDLKEALHASSAGADVEAESATVQRRRRVAWRVAVLSLGLALAAGIWLARLGGTPADAPVTRFEVVPTRDVPLVVHTATRDVALSPDGSRLAYVSADGSLVVRAFDRLEPRRLGRLGAGISSPVFSPDGRSIAFLSGPTLRVVPADGGPVTTLAVTGEHSDPGMAWGPDGTIVIASTRGLVRVSPGGGEPEALAMPDAARGESAFGAPSFLPGGRAVLFVVRPTESEAGTRIAVLDLVTRFRRDVLPSGTEPRYVPTGHLVYVSGDTLQAVVFDLETLAPRGEPAAMVDDLLVKATGTADLAIADNGTLVYVRAVARERRLAWVARDGREELLDAPPLPYAHVRLSPDRTRVAFAVRGRETELSLWDLEARRSIRLASDGVEDALVAWSRDGQRVVFGAASNGSRDLYWRAADGAVPAERLTRHGRRLLPLEPTPDGERLIVRQAQAGGAWDLATVRLDGSSRVEPLLATAASEADAALSPDGRWLAYTSDESGRTDVYVRPFPDVTRARWLISTEGGSKPLWSPDGREIYYVGPELHLVAARVETQPELRPGPVVRLFDASAYLDPEAGADVRPYDVDPAGGRFLMLRKPDDAEAPRVVVVLNWFEELERRLPRQ